MIVDKMIELEINNYVEYYESLGYDIPKYIDNKNREKVKRGTTILVWQKDIPDGSSTKIDVVCDIENCGNSRLIKKYSYTINKQKNNGRYICEPCLRREKFLKNLRNNEPERSFGFFLEKIFGKDNVYKHWSYKNNVSPYDVYSNSHVSYIFCCPNKEYHEYKKIPMDFSRGDRCPYCSYKKVHRFDSMGAMFPQSLSVYSEKNEKSVFEISPSWDNKVWWKCENNIHEDFLRPAYDERIYSFRCPYCVKERRESFLQEKVRLYLENYFDDVLHEWDCTINPRNPKTGGTLRYDNEVPSIKLIVEVMGMQHKDYHFYMNFFDEETSKKKLIETQWKDEFKKQHAINMNYTYLDIWQYEDDKNETWKKKINQCLYDIGYFN